MNRLLSLILVLGILMQVSGSVMQLLEYSINKSFIANRLCEKREIPDNGCQGKCHLKKELQKESQREQENPRQNAKPAADWKLNETSDARVFIPGVLNATYALQLTLIFYPGHPDSVFHPPGC